MDSEIERQIRCATITAYSDSIKDILKFCNDNELGDELTNAALDTFAEICRPNDDSLSAKLDEVFKMLHGKNK